MKSGYFRQGVFAATGSRNNINRTAQAESSPWPRRGLGNAHLSWVQSCLARVKGTHSALESRCRKASGGGFHSGGQKHSAKASLAVVSFAENLKRVLLCREVWKRLSPLPRDLAALPDLFPSTHSLHPQIDFPQMNHTSSNLKLWCGPLTPVKDKGGEVKVGTGGESVLVPGARSGQK